MSIFTAKNLVVVGFVVALGLLGAVLTPQSVSAQSAGSGGGGGSSGCSQFQYSTCFGAVWRYYRSTSNAYVIPNVGGGSTVVRGCSATGGFFAYVLASRFAPNDPTRVRSWQIGPVDGFSGNRSEFFGGWTRYRVFSSPSDPIPTNPTNGDYSWYSAQKAFAQSTALGQNNGFAWNGASLLGWFCYRGSDFNLTTTIGANRPAAEPGSTVTLTPSVNNSGSTQSSSAQWQVTRRIVPAGSSIPGASPSASVPIVYYGPGSSTIRNGSGVFQRGPTALAGLDTIMPDAPLDSRVCYALSIQPRRHDSSEWYHGPPLCIVISKSPKIQVIGGDVIVGSGATSSNIVTTAVRKNVSSQDRTFGSWGEYGVTANGRIVGMASGAGYSGGATGNFCSVSLLTFTNAGTNVCADATPKGGYAANPALPNLSSRFISTGTTNLGAIADINVADPNRVSGIYTASDRLTVLNSSSVPVGKWIVINAPNADVEITQNLTYSNGPISGIGEIPQLIIIADTISIASNVTRVDAWLVANGATGSINTCSEISNPADSGSPLTANRCNQQLTINGPVIAERLFLYRTAGSGTGLASGDPAEVFNIRPDAYLWATFYTATGGRVPTVNTQELPPRF